ncbi:unnamed protein product [Sphagnum troendelagicum]
MSLSRTHNFSSLICFVSSCRGWRSRDCVVGGGSEHRRNNGGEEVEMKLEELVAAASPGFHSSIDAFSPSCHSKYWTIALAGATIVAVATKDEEMETGAGEDDAKELVCKGLGVQMRLQEMKHLRWD